MRFGVLGPLEIDGQPAEALITSSRQQQVLAVLLSGAGRPVSRHRLVDALWPESPPDGAENTVPTYVSKLRKALPEPGRIVCGPAGYRLVLEPGELDAVEFETLIEQARAARGSGDLERGVHLLEEALGLWRGEPYAGLQGSADSVLPFLNRLRMDALAAHAELALDLGRHADIAPRLSELVAEHPADERLVASLMLALYRLNRQTDALALYRRTSRILNDPYGVEPGNDLRTLHQAILNRDPNLDLPVSARSRPVVVPAQLPNDIRAFAGRELELEQLNALLDEEQPEAVVISAVSGTAGIGKTALAVHWAHRIRHQFTDGQLYVNLRGFDPSGTVMKPAEAVRGFLDALGVAPERIPSDLDAQAALYRSLLNGKRVLVVLDNARDTDQLRPLLPGSAGCLAIATSRNNLASLVTKDAAHPLTLNVLSDTEAVSLLEQRLGKARISAAPEAVHGIIAACAGLPLALAIVAARAVTHPHFSLAVLADELRHTGLDALAGESDIDVRTVFSWSYQQLTPPAQQLFRYLGLHPGPDISAPAAASLIGLPVSDLHQLLTELTNANLVNEHLPGRYLLHDLLRAYATELTNACDTEDDQRTAIHRVLDHYLSTARTADRLLDPTRDALFQTPSLPGAAPESIDDYEQAMTWFTAEQFVLLACPVRAANAGLDTHAWQLVWTLNTFLRRRGKWEDLMSLWHAALGAANRLHDRAAQATAHRLLATADLSCRRFDEAHIHLQRALTLSVEIGDRTERARTHHVLGALYERQDEYAQALHHAQEALTSYQAVENRMGEADTLNAIGWYYAHLGAYQRALGACTKALMLFQELGSQEAEAHTWDSLGYVHHHLGHHTAAVRCYHNALGLYRNLRYLQRYSDSLCRLGDAQQTAGDSNAARQAWEEALAILDELDHHDAEAVRAKLNQLRE